MPVERMIEMKILTELIQQQWSECRHLEDLQGLERAVHQMCKDTCQSTIGWAQSLYAGAFSIGD